MFLGEACPLGVVLPGPHLVAQHCWSLSTWALFFSRVLRVAGESEQ